VRLARLYKEDLTPVAHHEPLSEILYQKLREGMGKLEGEVCALMDLMDLTGWRPADLGYVKWDGSHLVALRYKTQRGSEFPPLLFLVDLLLLHPLTVLYLQSRVNLYPLFPTSTVVLRVRASAGLGIRVNAFGLRVRRLRILGSLVSLEDLQTHTRHRRRGTLESSYLGSATTLAQKRIRDALRKERRLVQQENVAPVQATGTSPPPH